MKPAISTAIGSSKLLLGLLLVCGCGTSRKAQLEQVAKDWCQTIRASQVIPVYPLTEDLQPGDLFLVDMDVSEQHEQYEEKGFLPLDNHLARLADISYAEFYRSSFAPGEPQPKNWLEQTPPFSLKAPEAAFPSYTFTASRGGGLSLAVPLSGVPVGLSLLGAQEATGSVTISDAHTYGLPIIDMVARVEAWAGSNRAFLAQYASTDDEPRFLRVVSRIYLTGEVDITLQDARSVGADLAVGAPRPVELVTAKTGGDTGAVTAANYKENVSELNKMVAEGSSATGAGGRVKIAAASARSITLKEKFDRPLVIGYVGFDMRILDDGLLGPPVPSLAVVRGQREPGKKNFFSAPDRLYIATKERARAKTPAELKTILESLGVTSPDPLDYNKFSRALARWRRKQDDKDAAKQKIIAAINAAS